jgi:hypothetical protein
MFDKNFTAVIQSAVADVSFFTYPLQVIAEGLQSTQSTPLLCSFECVELIFSYGCRMNNADFKKAIQELLTTQPLVI